VKGSGGVDTGLETAHIVKRQVAGRLHLDLHAVAFRKLKAGADIYDGVKGVVGEGDSEDERIADAELSLIEGEGDIQPTHISRGNSDGLSVDKHGSGEDEQESGEAPEGLGGAGTDG
jgi:hypothetical protein